MINNTTPRNTDVMPGNSRHSGNKVYSELIKDKKKAFVLASMRKDTKTKDDIVQSIYDGVSRQSPPGRFLGKNKDGSYSIKSKKEAIAKIKKALNENRKTIESFFKFRGQEPASATKKKVKTTKSASLDTSSDRAKLLSTVQEKKLKREDIKASLKATNMSATTKHNKMKPLPKRVTFEEVSQSLAASHNTRNTLKLTNSKVLTTSEIKSSKRQKIENRKSRGIPELSKQTRSIQFNSKINRMSHETSDVSFLLEKMSGMNVT